MSSHPPIRERRSRLGEADLRDGGLLSLSLYVCMYVYIYIYIYTCIPLSCQKGFADTVPRSFQSVFDRRGMV